MIRDIHLGFLILIVTAGAIAHRALPRLANKEKGNSQVAATELALPVEENPEKQTEKKGNKNDENPSDALTKIFPDGYDAQKASAKKASESKESPKESKPLDPPKKSESEPAATSEPKDEKKNSKEEKAPKEEKGDGPVLLVDEDGPKMPALADAETESNDEKNPQAKSEVASQEEEIVTEFVPFTEELSLPDDDKATGDKQTPKKEERSSESKSLAKAEGKSAPATPTAGNDLEQEDEEPVAPSLFPPPGKRTSAPTPQSEKSTLAKSKEEISARAGSAETKLASRAKSKDKPTAVFSFDRRVQATDDVKTEKGGAATAGNPVHPFFQRYLERKTYFVREGDSLESIAQKLYQDRTVVDRLLEANKHQITRTEDLRPGMLLRLP